MLISALGAIDDGDPGLSPPLKFLGQAGCAIIPVSQGVTIDHFTLPFIDPVSLGAIQYPITVVFIVAVANIVNFADGMDGLAAGLCLISAGTFCVLALSLDRFAAATLAAAVCGACLGFLPWNFHPAKIFMGDAGSLPLGFLLASMSITGVMKTAAALALVFPLIVLLVPILDTSFVILKRLKYSQSVTSPTATTCTTGCCESATRSGRRRSSCTAGASCWRRSRWPCGSCTTSTRTARSTSPARWRCRVRARRAVGVGVRRVRARDHQVPPPADDRDRAERRSRGRRAAGRPSAAAGVRA